MDAQKCDSLSGIDLCGMSVKQLRELGDAIVGELAARPNGREKNEATKAALRGIECPKCKSADVVKNGHVRDGTQLCLCKACGKRFVATTGRTLSAAKLGIDKLKGLILLFLCDVPLWVMAVLLRISVTTAFLWRKRLSEQAVESFDSKDCVLSGKAWLDEIECRQTDRGLLITREDGHLPRGGSANQDYFLVGCDIHGHYLFKEIGYGFPSSEKLEKALEGRIAKGTLVIVDKARYHTRALKKCGAIIEEHKADKSDPEWERALGPVNNLCAFIRFEAWKHRGIKIGNMERLMRTFIYKMHLVAHAGLETAAEIVMTRLARSKKQWTFADVFPKKKKSDENPEMPDENLFF